MLATRARKIISFRSVHITHESREERIVWWIDMPKSEFVQTREKTRNIIRTMNRIKPFIYARHNNDWTHFEMPFRRKLWRPRPMAAAIIAEKSGGRAFIRLCLRFFSVNRNNEPAGREHESESDITSRRKTHIETGPRSFCDLQTGSEAKKNHIMEIKTKVRNKCSSLQLSVHFCFSRWSVRVVLWKRSFWDTT